MASAALLPAAGGGLIVFLLPLVWLLPAVATNTWSQTGPRLQISHTGREHTNTHFVLIQNLRDVDREGVVSVSVSVELFHTEQEKS